MKTINGVHIPIRDIVICQWSAWTNGSCTKSCGGGSRTNVRTEEVKAAHGGDECVGSSTSEENCNTEECPGNTKLISILAFDFQN